MTNELDLRVPPVFGRPLELLKELSTEQFGAFANALSELSLRSSRKTVVEGLIEAVDGLSKRDAAMLLDFVTQTRTVVARMGVDAEAVSAAVAKSLGAGDDDALTGRLSELLASRFIAMREKAIGLQREPEPRLEGARCLTDLRPVFGVDGGTDDVLGFVVISTLLLQLDGDHQDRGLAVRVSRSQLESLREVVDRALDKHQTLEETLAKAGLDDLTQEEGS